MRRPLFHHACDGCGHAWSSRESWPKHCVNCRRAIHWIATFPYPERAQAHAAIALRRIEQEAASC